MWPYRKIVTQSLTTPLVIARIIFYFALLMLLPLPFMVTSDSFWVASGRVYYLMFSLPIAMVLMLVSSLMAIMIAKVEALNNR
ncbi:hypothetical protein ACQ2HG_06675 [Aeromonas hydrophila]|uniref:Uncharacterized protein n=1 Tax=Aeromonas bestiarum TaxID=105751 RepID=A0AAW7IB13_9GAMM|nr:MULTISPECIES: hypothetical protein [Aeromonas]HDZ8854740.1 hypothetical protein [Aeromonas dhakensis]AZU49041.1 hypothetical protein C3B79_3289 [Aeromonas hydrophila]EJN6953751.1 hypothetical protein [Aeromonas hydrophila]KER61994.1 hypothetical protein HR52_02730 [Aeromonas hydrophila]MBC6486213.1 hypothetical protein [Aeromonas hydrophila]